MLDALIVALIVENMIGLMRVLKGEYVSSVHVDTPSGVFGYLTW